MGRAITDWKKHGYFHGLEDSKPKHAIKLFCQRRSADIVKDFSHTLTYGETLARVYFQGLIDGKEIWENSD